MTRDQAPQKESAQDDRLDVMKAATGNPESSQEARVAIEEFAQKGNGDPKQLPFLMRHLNNMDARTAMLNFPELATRVGAKLFLDCCAALRYPTNFSVKFALETTSPTATDTEIRTYLRQRSTAELLELDADEQLIAKLKAILPKALGQELPAFAGFHQTMVPKHNLLRWWIDSTPVEVASIELIQHGSPELAKALDEIDRWGWLDQLQVGSRFTWGARELQTTTNKHAQARLAELLKPFPADPDADDTEARNKARDELNAHIEDPAFTNQQVLDATARAGSIAGTPVPEMYERMKGQPAADVFQFVVASPGEPAKMMDLMLASPDVTPDHVLGVMQYVAGISGRLEILQNAKLRLKVRKVLKGTALHTLFPEPDIAELVHFSIVKDDALFAWALESKDPHARLWLAAGSIDGEKRALRQMKDQIGLDWILSLPTDGNIKQLRRLALMVDGKHDAYVSKLIGDSPIADTPADWQTEESDAAIKNKDDVAQFRVATMVDSSTEEDILGRLADLEPDERKAMADSPRDLEAAVGSLAGDALIRAVYQLQPTIAQLLGTKLKYEVRLLSYLRTRSASEEAEAASSAVMTTRARELFMRSPFVIFPSLLEPATLARAITKNNTLLKWIFEEAEPNQALSVLSQDPAKAKAVAALESIAEPMTQFPRYKHLMPEGRAGIDAIARSVSEEETKDNVKDYQANKVDPDDKVDKTGKAVHDAAKGDHLWDAINAVEKPDANSLLALVRAYPGDHLAILAGNHEKAITRLQQVTYLGPQIVFPEVTPMQLMAFSNARRWLFEYEPPFVVLSLVRKDPGALKLLGKQIDTGGDAIDSWLANLPRGATLDAQERVTLDNLRAHVKTEAGIRKLFGVRFDISMQDSFDHQRTNDIWDALRRLPPAQVNQKTISSFVRQNLTNPGFWGDPNVVMTTDEEQLNLTGDSYENSSPLSKDKIKSYYGLDDAAFAKATDKANGWIVEENGQFKVKPVHMRVFESTVLHEVGHSIDTLLGERTELVFGIAAWKNYGIDQVEAWANDLGALAGVSGTKKADIVEAWRHALRTDTPVADLVGADHPAVDPKLAHVPLVKAGIDGSKFHHKEKRQVGNRVGVTGTNQGTIGVVPVETADVAPSAYSLSAPGEFFAECYVEYYRNYDGTSSTKDKKGGNLPPAYRAWFDQNVDKIELNPHRYDKAEGDADGAPSPSASATPKPKKNG